MHDVHNANDLDHTVQFLLDDAECFVLLFVDLAHLAVGDHINIALGGDQRGAQFMADILNDFIF